MSAVAEASEVAKAHSSYSWDGIAPPALHDCPHPWDRVDITNTGDVLACCFARESLGRIGRGGLHAVLNGPRRKRLQDDVRHDRINPACFNAACIYAYRSTKQNWTVQFPPDRFRVLGFRTPHVAWCFPAFGSMPFASGPTRFLPAAKIEVNADVVVTGPKWTLSRNASLMLDVVDEEGRILARSATHVRASGLTTMVAHFDLLESSHSRISFRLWAKHLRRVLIFRGIRLSGTPSGLSGKTQPFIYDRSLGERHD